MKLVFKLQDYTSYVHKVGNVYYFTKLKPFQSRVLHFSHALHLYNPDSKSATGTQYATKHC